MIEELPEGERITIEQEAIRLLSLAIQVMQIPKDSISGHKILAKSIAGKDEPDVMALVVITAALVRFKGDPVERAFLLRVMKETVDCLVPREAKKWVKEHHP